MKTKNTVTHSPAPFRLSFPKYELPAIRDANEQVIAYLQPLSGGAALTGEAYANGAVFLAAPDMLAALEAVLPLLPTGNLKACDDARLAVARAKGEA